MSALDAGRGVRASDAERERVAQVLQRATADGRLSPEEAGERLATASAARYREELARLVTDLPGGTQALMPEAMAAGRRVGAAVWVVWGLARVAVMMALLAGIWFMWGVRFFWVWPLAFVWFGGMLRWRRRMWRYHMAHGGGE